MTTKTLVDVTIRPYYKTKTIDVFILVLVVFLLNKNYNAVYYYSKLFKLLFF